MTKSSTNFIGEITSNFPCLLNLEYGTILYESKKGYSLATAIVKSNIPYKPGIYLIYEYDISKHNLGKLLYVGKAGADKTGAINNHQLPKRLLATIKLKEEYWHHEKVPINKELTRDKGFPIMMEIDNIETILIFCFFSNITSDNKVDNLSNPLKLENEINTKLKNRPLKWSKR
jgi:hypothetical protein